MRREIPRPAPPAPESSGPAAPRTVKRLYLLMSHAIDDELRQHGLARAQWQALAHVHEAGTLSQRLLQERMAIESATLTVIVELLASKGWLERLPDPTDKRVRLLRFTPDGHERWHTVPDPVAIVQSRMLAGFSDADAERTRKLLTRMITNLENERKA